MTTNPYAQDAASDFGHEIPSEPPRMSILAIVALVLSLVCFIPGLPTIGSVLGVFAILVIVKGQGRVKGTGIAIAAVLLGLLFSMLQLGIALGANALMKEYAQFGEPIVFVEADDETALRGMLAESTNDALSADDIAAFKAAYTADAGGFVGVPKGLLPVIRAFGEIGDPNASMDPSKVPYANPVPVPGEFANGQRLIWTAMSQGEINQTGSLPAIVNIGVVLSDDSVAWLIDPDTLRDAAGGGSPVPADTNADTDADTDADTNADAGSGATGEANENASEGAPEGGGEAVEPSPEPNSGGDG